ncbi:acetylornithine deacetylase or succinyl- diaminopimelate desuccinylase [Kribbella flavida DSM 17836]|uniref:Acetylornithine deacetylase or succinyl-diaminopimelate desuccinylase n=1 Tax=Kribbella flavida (strain DSM 17836 / JCM 10339 / NBRC 14399) TaxID=479435 RepID=D2Q4Y2_KRIFD|nr:ArgE/DapE family deacylase [Kribbella flavida]ADB34237.1 acetylornithine deacetylase or succinyl- diaminopimelate desuccinylase [Kribbella flavida DSM 17836]
MLSEVERAVLAAVDDALIVEQLGELVRIPSVDGTAAESEVQEWMAERLREQGLAVDHWEIDLAEVTADPEFPGMEVARSEAWGCVGTLGGDGTPGLVLNGHVDVVPPGDLALWPDGDPFSARVADGIMWGRGTCDMKGGVAAVLGATAAIVAAGIELRRPLAVHTVVGEEDGGLGAFATLRRGHTGAACVIAEPTAGAVIPANAGSLTFRLEVAGLATHGSTRTRGVSAIEKFEPVHAALRELEAARNEDPHPLLEHLDLANPLSIGTIQAGDWASTVPDLLVAEGRYGVRLGEPVADARAAFEQAVATACEKDDWLRDHPVKVSWPGGVFASGLLPDGDPLLDDTVQAAVDAGAAGVPAVLGGPYGSDLRQYAAAGVPTVQYGPGDVRYAHATDEHVALAEVLHCARVYALLAVRRCA